MVRSSGLIPRLLSTSRCRTAGEDACGNLNKSGMTLRLDTASIIIYPIPACWTEDGFTVGWNKALSQADKQFIGQQYPFVGARAP